MLGPARHAPRGEEVDQHRTATGFTQEVGARNAGLAVEQRRQRKLGRRPVEQCRRQHVGIALQPAMKYATRAMNSASGSR